MYVPVNGRAIRLGRTPDAVNGAVLRAYSVLRAWRLIRLSVYLMWVAKEGKRSQQKGATVRDVIERSKLI